MDLRSGSPFWLAKNGLIQTFPSLHDDVTADVAIIGAGITGSLMGYYLGRAGMSVVIADRRHAGMGSTVASTGLLQYEIDMPLYLLAKRIGEYEAMRCYYASLEALYTIEDLVKELGARVDFQRRPSLQYASTRHDVKGLELEFELRQSFGFAVRWFDKKDIREKYGFHAPAGIFSSDGAVIDAYEFSQTLLARSMKLFDVKVFDNTEIVHSSSTKSKIELMTSDRRKIRAKFLIVCAGYESTKYLTTPLERKLSTYAIASEPIHEKNIWYKNSMIWETARPYLYLRTTKDGRIIIGGRDDGFYNPDRRDTNLPAKSRSLFKDFKKLFPKIEFKIDFQWAGTFCSTKDGLPYIGALPGRTNIFFALGYGGNGITFSLLAAEIISDAITGRSNDKSDLFRFDR